MAAAGKLHRNRLTIVFLEIGFRKIATGDSQPHGGPKRLQNGREASDVGAKIVPHAITGTPSTAAYAWKPVRRLHSTPVGTCVSCYAPHHVCRRLHYLFHISLRSRCTAMLAGLRTLIQTREGPDR